MPNQERLDYYRRRESAERQSAASAEDPTVANVHLQLADWYARIVQEASGKTTSTRLPPPHVTAARGSGSDAQR